MSEDRQGGWKMRYNCGMKSKLTFLLSPTFLFLFGSSSAGEEKDLDQEAFIREGDCMLVKLKGI